MLGLKMTMKYLKTCFCCVLLALFSADAGCSPVLRNLDSDTWMTFSLGGHRIGYEHDVVRRKMFHGQPVYCSESDVEFGMTAYEMNIRGSVLNTVCVDGQFHPLFERCKTTVKSTNHPATYLDNEKTVEADFSTQAIDCNITQGGKVTHKRIPIPKGTDFRSSLMWDFGARSLLPGERITSSYFDSDLLNIGRVVMKGLRYEKFALSGKSYNTVVTSCAYQSGSETICWGTTEDGLLRVKLNMLGFEVEELKSDKEHATTDWQVTDFEPMKADYPISDPLRVVGLRLRIVGFQGSPARVISDARQKGATVGGDSVEYEVTAKNFDPSKSRTLPILDPKYSEWRKESPGVEVGDKYIASQAKSIIGSSTNAYEAACKLRSWVRENMTGMLDSNTPLSAVAVLRSKTGDCKHASILYTAMARSVGIPTRFAEGIVYFNGAFYGHEWVESYVGEWVPLDPSFSEEVVDATHIKLGSASPLATAPSVLDYFQTSESVQILKCRYRPIAGTGPMMIPKGCHRVTCPHGINFDIPAGCSGADVSCKIHESDSASDGWTKVLWSDGKMYYYPSRTHLSAETGVPAKR